MFASLAVILENLWLKKSEIPLRQEKSMGTEIQQINDKNDLLQYESHI